MSDSQSSPLLLNAFPQTDIAAWLEKVKTDLKGKSPASLDWKIEADVTLAPFYRPAKKDAGLPAPGEFPFRRGDQLNAQADAWQTVQEISVDGTDPVERMQEAAAVGIYAFKLFPRGGSVAGTGPYEQLFTRMNFREQALHLFGNAVDKTALFAALETAAGPNSDTLTGTYFHAETMNPTLSGVMERQAGILRKAEGLPYFRALGIDLSFFAESGASHIQQMAFGLALIADYVAEMSERGIKPEAVFQNVAIGFSCGSSFFPELAKLRAFRVLYARFLKAYDIEAPAAYMPFLLAQGTSWNLSRYDKHSNLLRNTTEAISAILGGCHALALPAFDKAEAAEDALSARMARNIQFLLQNEAYLDTVKDAGGGSYYIETLTDKLIETAWQRFLQIEKGGGYTANYSALEAEILEIQQAQQEAYARQKKVLVGINKYPNTQEVKPVEDKSFGAGDLYQPIGGEQTRIASAFERLRKQVDTLAQQRGKRFQSFLFLFGDARMRNARALFSRNLVGAGGLEIMENSTPANLDTSLDEAIRQNPEALVLCSSDKDYFDSGADLIARLKKALPNTVLLLAGKPENAEQLDVDNFLYAGMDAVVFLEELMRTIVSRY